MEMIPGGFIFEMRHKITGKRRYIRTVEKGVTVEKGTHVTNFDLGMVRSKDKATRFRTAEIASLATGSLSLMELPNLEFSVVEVEAKPAKRRRRKKS